MCSGRSNIHIKYVNKFAHERVCVSDREKRKTDRETQAVYAACLAAEAANPLSMTPRNTLSTKVRISNKQAAGFCVSLQMYSICGCIAYAAMI